MKCLLISALVASSALTAQAWWCNGHMLTAAVARKYVDSSVIQKVDNLVDFLSDDYPMSPEYLSSACWPDDLKAQDVMQMANNHFTNMPVVKGALYSGIQPISNSTGVVWAIQQAQKTLASSKSHTIDKARQIRFLLHFIGDIHQPLHTMTLYNTFFPDGDQGGNKYLISGANQTSLHMFYDSGAGMWQSDQPRPLQSNSTDWLNMWADRITGSYPQSYFGNQRINEPDQANWVDESVNAFANFVYSTPYGKDVASDYVMKARQVCMQQVALGGYRLAVALNTIFG